jgi:hypothetical protein
MPGKDWLLGNDSWELIPIPVSCVSPAFIFPGINKLGNSWVIKPPKIGK